MRTASLNMLTVRQQFETPGRVTLGGTLAVVNSVINVNMCMVRSIKSSDLGANEAHALFYRILARGLFMRPVV